MALYTDTDNTCPPKMRLPDPQIGPGAHFSSPKSKLGPFGPLCFFDRAANGNEQSVNMRGSKKKKHFLSIRNFSLVIRKFRKKKKPVSKNMHVESIQWVLCLLFVFSKLSHFFGGAQIEKQGPFRETHVSKLGPELPKGFLATEKEAQKGAHSGFWMRQDSQGRATTLGSQKRIGWFRPARVLRLCSQSRLALPIKHFTKVTTRFPRCSSIHPQGILLGSR